MSQSSHTAFITGASSGIGAIYAERLAARGYDLILAARREDRLQTLAGQLQARYAIRASILKADLSEEQGIEAVEQRLQQDPAVDLFINNAGTAKMAGFLASTSREHQAIHTLNTTALLRLSYAALAAFAPRGRGTLINIASILALHTLPGSAVYSASKAWVLSFTRGLQDEFADSGVRIQAVLPAATATDLWPTSGVALDALPAGTVMTTEDLVDAALRGLEMGEKVTLPMRCMIWDCGRLSSRRDWRCLPAREPGLCGAAVSLTRPGGGHYSGSGTAARVQIASCSPPRRSVITTLSPAFLPSQGFRTCSTIRSRLA